MAGLSYHYLDTVGARAIFFPRPDPGPTPPDAEDITVNVAPGVALGGRFYAQDPRWPSILYFHGNGEVASDHDDIAQLYHTIKVNLLVVEFRGYGRSTGQPSFATLVGDCAAIVAWFHRHLDRRGFSSRRFVMGRSLGCHPALEIAANLAERFGGLIIESGAASVHRLLERLGVSGVPAGEALAAAHDEKLREITLPTLIIHGEQDDLVPPNQATRLQSLLGGHVTELLMVAGGGHNDLLGKGRVAYFDAIRRLTHHPC